MMNRGVAAPRFFFVLGFKFSFIALSENSIVAPTGRQRRSRQRPPCVKGAVILTQKWQNDWGIDNPSVKNQRFLPPPFAQGRLCAALAALSAHRADKFKQHDKPQFVFGVHNKKVAVRRPFYDFLSGCGRRLR